MGRTRRLHPPIHQNSSGNGRRASTARHLVQAPAQRRTPLVQQDPNMGVVIAVVVIALALFTLIGFIVHRAITATAGRPVAVLTAAAAVLTAAASVIAVLPIIIRALVGG
ncbi:hypothetical protein ACFQ07_03075 [Actinomadura adrarensis]|uniref:DUF4190 domain-containing protein n=1 Tax=Actinomadura adrarensis TaxID=1819600 RepID=A0ABW3CA71_9ACTN